MEFDDLRHFAEASEVRAQRAEFRGRIEKVLAKTGHLASDMRRVLQKSTPDQMGMYESLKIVREQLIEILKLEDASLFGAVGDTFDPDQHCALESRQSEIEDGLVVEVETEGLRWEGQIVTKAAVIVSRKTK